VLDLERRAVQCACAACALLFERPGAARGRFRAVPERVLAAPGWVMPEEDWAALEIPVRLAFLLRSSAAGRWVAVYPSPAGPTESALPPDAWARVAASCPLAPLVEPDVEALLLRGGEARGGGGPLSCLLAPVDRCYALVGIVRRSWRGFDGGDEVRREIEVFFAELSARARRAGGATCSNARGA
jgi:hypothetical protein